MGRWPERKAPAAKGARGEEAADSPSIQFLELAGFALELLGVALDCRRGLALPRPCGFLIVFAAPNLGQHAGLFTGALKAAQGYVEGLVLFDTY
jgi:hypothetical protein